MHIKKKPMTGAQAVAEAMRQIEPDVFPVYPITPQTPIAEFFAAFKADGLVGTEVVMAESEHSVMSIAIGASAAGARAMTATSSQGLALMWELLPAASGMRLPIVLFNVNRALSAPLNIHCDHSDSMGAKDQGWVQMFAEDAQESYEMMVLALKLAEKISMPVMVMHDGFIISHGVEIVNILEDSRVKRFVGKRKPEFSLLDVQNPVTFGAMQLPNALFETKIQQADAMKDALKAYLQSGNELKKLTKSDYGYFENYRLNDADAVIVVTSSTAGTVKDVVDRMRKAGRKVGMMKIRLFRPFPYDAVAKALQGAKAVAVLDRCIAYGANAPLCSDVLQSLFNSRKKPKVQSCIFGIGGRDIFDEQVEALFSDLLKGKTGSMRYIR